MNHSDNFCRFFIALLFTKTKVCSVGEWKMVFLDEITGIADVN